MHEKFPRQKRYGLAGNTIGVRLISIESPTLVFELREENEQRYNAAQSLKRVWESCMSERESEIESRVRPIGQC